MIAEGLTDEDREFKTEIASVYELLTESPYVLLTDYSDRWDPKRPQLEDLTARVLKVGEVVGISRKVGEIGGPANVALRLPYAGAYAQYYKVKKGGGRFHKRDPEPSVILTIYASDIYEVARVPWDSHPELRPRWRENPLDFERLVYLLFARCIATCHLTSQMWPNPAMIDAFHLRHHPYSHYQREVRVMAPKLEVKAITHPLVEEDNREWEPAYRYWKWTDNPVYSTIGETYGFQKWETLEPPAQGKGSMASPMNQMDGEWAAMYYDQEGLAVTSQIVEPRRLGDINHIKGNPMRRPTIQELLALPGEGERVDCERLIEQVRGMPLSAYKTPDDIPELCHGTRMMMWKQFGFVPRPWQTVEERLAGLTVLIQMDYQEGGQGGGEGNQAGAHLQAPQHPPVPIAAGAQAAQPAPQPAPPISGAHGSAGAGPSAPSAGATALQGTGPPGAQQGPDLTDIPEEERRYRREQIKAKLD